MSIILAVLAGVATACSCQGPEESQPTPTIAPTTTIAPTIIEQHPAQAETVGGTVHGPDGVLVDIPPLIGIEPAQVTIREVPPPSDSTETDTLVSPVYEITSLREVLPAPITITLPLHPDALAGKDDKTLIQVAYWSENQWLPMGGQVDEYAGTISVQTRHLSWFAAILSAVGIAHETEHFVVIPRCIPIGGIDPLKQRLEGGWELEVTTLGYDLPMESRWKERITVRIRCFMKNAGTISGLPETFEAVFYDAVNYDIYINSNLDGIAAAVTPAHELFHVIQMNGYPYDSQDKTAAEGQRLWWMEATANWMGAKALGKGNEYQEYQRVHQLSDKPIEERSVLARALDDGGDDNYQRFRAGTFVRYLEELYGADIIKETWVKLQTERDSLKVLDDILGEKGSSLGETYRDFAFQYGYLRDSEWLQKTLELGENAPGPVTSLKTLQASTEEQSVSFDAPHLSAEVIEITSPAQGTLHLDFDWTGHPDTWRIKVFAHGDAPENSWFDVTDPQWELDLPRFGRETAKAVIVAVNQSLNTAASLDLSYQMIAPPIALDAILIAHSENTSLSPGASGIITFDLQNTGHLPWLPDQVLLENVDAGALGTAHTHSLVAEIPSGQVTQWVLPVTAPEAPGIYRPEWRMFYDDEPFGPAMSALVVVSPDIEPGEIGIDPIDIDPTGLDPLGLLKEWFTGLVDRYLDKIRAFMEDLQRRLIEWLELEAERLLEELVSYLSELCCGAPLVPPAAVLLGTLGLRKRRKRQ